MHLASHIFEKEEEGCTAIITEYQAGAVFFALDIKNVGYVHRSYFSQHYRQAIREHIPEIEPDRMEELVNHYLFGDTTTTTGGSSIMQVVSEVLSC